MANNNEEILFKFEAILDKKKKIENTIKKLQANKEKVMKDAKILCDEGWEGVSADAFQIILPEITAALDENINRVEFLKDNLEKIISEYKSLEKEG